MKRFITLVLPIFFCIFSFGQANLFVKESEKQNKGVKDIEISVGNYYKYRPDGKPGRGVVINFNKSKFEGEGKIEVECKGKKEVFLLDLKKGIKSYEILLAPEIGIEISENIKVSFNSEKINFTNDINVPAFRHWEILIYPHSHVDIGYTNTHANVELIHTRNVVNGLKLAKRTKNYPEGARYKWNPEVIWPVERYLSKATNEEKQIIFDGVRDGFLPLDAGYVNVNTTLASEEELIEFFRQGQEYEKITGQKIETLVQVDIPGMSWGMIPLAAKLGIKYIFSFNNGYDRVGWSTDHNFKPFWWSDAQGKNKLLYLQPGSYNPGALIKGKYYWPKMAGQTNPDKLIEIVKTDNPRENFIDTYLNEKLHELEKSDYYPYKIFPMSWAMADNTPIDADLPEAVKSWNEEFAFPKLKIVSATEIMSEFDERYGDQMPVYKGDFTEFWTDGGAGTAAHQTAQNRASKERLVQTETLWTMLNADREAPRDEFNDAWWNILMGSEHTWCYMAPHQEPLNSEILETKFDFFNNAQSKSLDLLAKTISVASAKKGKEIVLFNNLSWERDGIVRLTSEQAQGYNNIADEEGNILLSQLLSGGELVFKSPEIPSFGSIKLVLTNAEINSSAFMLDGTTLDNGIVKIELDEKNGDIVNLIYKTHDYVDNDADCDLNSYLYLKGNDDPEKAFRAKNAKFSVKENGPLLSTIVVETVGKGSSKITSEITMYAGQENIDIKNVVDKIGTIEKEGVHFGFAFNIQNPKVVADIPWGMIEIDKDQLPGSNRNWITLQRWLDVSNEKRGMTWVPLDAPLFQVGNITANILGAATESDEWLRNLEPSGTIYSWALNNHWHTNFQLSQEGEITFRYRLKPHTNGYNYVEANRYAIEQHQPIIATVANKEFKCGQLVKIEGSPAIMSTVFKTSKDGKSAILRLRSVSDKNEDVELKWVDRIPASVHLFDIEEEENIVEITQKVTVPANDFVTLKVTW